jgi:hypothetical protein|nr:MAG TPA: hypothetical protein [Caudoviricetes sp.]
MTISEVEQQLADMGFKLSVGDNYYYYVEDPDDCRYDHRYAYVSKNCRFAVDTDTDWFKSLQTKKRKRLFNLLTEFAATPLDKRQNTKYYVSVEYQGYFGKNRTFWVSEYNSFVEDYELSSKYQDAAKFEEEVADKIIGMLPPIAAIKKTKVAAE